MSFNILAAAVIALQAFHLTGVGALVPPGNCTRECGGVEIPYPFGIDIEDGCQIAELRYRQGFKLACRDKGSRGKKLYYINQEVLDISLQHGQVRWLNNISSYCYNATTGSMESHSPPSNMDLQGTIFRLSATANKFTVIGCKTLAYIGDKDNVSSYTTACGAATCKGANLSLLTDGACEGIGCCRTAIPRGLENYRVWFDKNFTTGPETGTASCSYAALVEASNFTFSASYLTSSAFMDAYGGQAPLVVDWAIGTLAGETCESARVKPESYACVSYSSVCVDSPIGQGYICNCPQGYQGNPYLPYGCKDIDECKQGNPCSNGGVCKNRLRGYDCPCKSGMKDDGKGGPCTEIFPLAAKAAVGAIGGILLLVILSFVVILRKEKKKMKEFYKKNGGPTLEKANVIKLFKKGDLKPILKSSNLIGKGCFGEVYKGILGNKLVAIKKPINGSALETDQFANEVIIQSQVIHKNIVRLIGCCLEVDAPMLVYEFISQGSVHDIIHNNNPNKVFLNLDARVSIAAQSADGLAYMHSKANIRILHGDVKPANILLDDNFIAKISDFGISRLIARDKEQTGSIIGDMNYMDPVYLQDGILTEKNDVYSFGVVILELISSRRAIHSDKNNMVKSFLEAHKKQKKATELFDKEIAIPEDLELLDTLVGMAMECLSLNVDQRPTMMEIAERLLILSRSRKV